MTSISSEKISLWLLFSAAEMLSGRVEILGEKRAYMGGKWYSFTCPLDYMPVFVNKEAVIETEDVKMYVEDER